MRTFSTLVLLFVLSTFLSCNQSDDGGTTNNTQQICSASIMISPINPPTGYQVTQSSPLFVNALSLAINPGTGKRDTVVKNFPFTDITDNIEGLPCGKYILHIPSFTFNGVTSREVIGDTIISCGRVYELPDYCATSKHVYLWFN